MSIKSLKTVNYVVIAKYLHKNDDRKVQCVYHLNRAIASKIFLDLGGGLFNPGGSFLKSQFFFIVSVRYVYLVISETKEKRFTDYPVLPERDGW